MEIVVADQSTFCISPSMSLEEAKGRIAAHKVSAFGGITQFFSRPKPEDVAVDARGLRFEPLWHATAHFRIVYDRRETYRFPIKSPENVAGVEIGGTTFSIDGDKKERGISVTALAHCVRDFTKEIWIDGTSGETIEARAFPPAQTASVEIDSFAPSEGAIVEPAIRASTVIRQLLGDDVAPPEADAVHDERVEIDRFELYFRPVFEFNLAWTAKGKNVDVLLDALSGEVVQLKSPLHPLLGKLLHKETLFDIGSETLNLVVPGGAIPLKIVRALRGRQSDKR
jgi:hypothetical protein